MPSLSDQSFCHIKIFVSCFCYVWMLCKCVWFLNNPIIALDSSKYVIYSPICLLDIFKKSCSVRACVCVCVCMLYTRLVTKVIKRKSLWSVERSTCFAPCHSLHPSFSSPSSIYSCLWQWWKTHTVCPVGLYLCVCLYRICMCMNCYIYTYNEMRIGLVGSPCSVCIFALLWEQSSTTDGK